MKLDKAVVDRRIHLMEEEGVKFVTNVNVGKDIKAEELLKQFDRVILACGASNPRDIKVPGRDAKGIYFAVDFLGQVTKALLDSDFAKVPYELAKGKNVLVIGGGDTGNDCVGTSIRLGAKSVIQLEMMPKPPSGKEHHPIHGRSGRESSKQTMARKKLSQYSDMIHEYTRLLLQNLSKIKTEMSARQSSQN